MQFEYKTLKMAAAGSLTGGDFDAAELERTLNFHGWEGWELVNIFDTNYGHGGTRYLVAVMKRVMTEQRRQELQAGR
jgi:hypothetical protein